MLSAVLQAAIMKETTKTCHILSFSVGASEYRFSEETIWHLGNMYQPGLRIVSSVRYSEKLQMEPLAVELQNITLETAAMLKAESVALQGQEASLGRLFLDVNESLLIFRGRISEIVVDDMTATLSLTTELDPMAARIPTRHYSALCTWDFQDANCGYLPDEDPLDPQTALPFTFCPKDFISCEQRGRHHRFPGILHLTREVSESIG